MLRHIVESCTDDPALLAERLDALAQSGARIVSVVWQARRVDEDDQSAALDARGGYVIVAERPEGAILRERPTMGEVFDEVVEGGRA